MICTGCFPAERGEAPRFAPLACACARGEVIKASPRLEGGLTYRPGLDRGPAQPSQYTAIRKRAKANGWTRDLSGARFAKVWFARGFARTCSPG
jgi:hypothetical protein